jgi:hypothetical protein
MKTYSCGELKTLVKGTNLSPYVTVTFEEGVSSITVGNKSDPKNGNQAAIKSFQTGWSSGSGTEIEIVDEQGGDFESFMRKLNKTLDGAQNDYRMKVQWGWLNSDCGATSGSTVISSQVFIFIPIKIEASFAEGKIHFKIMGTSLLDVSRQASQDVVYGADGNKINIKTAIRKLFVEDAPEINTVNFYRSNQGTLSEYGFKAKDGGSNGPVGKWPANQTNKLVTAMAWLEPFVTDQGKGIVPVWNPKTPGGEIIFFEDAVPKCDEEPNWCSRNIGTYLVNGGNCSSVISFNPVSNWVYSQLMKSGGAVPIGDGKTITDTGDSDCTSEGDSKGAGHMTYTPLNAQVFETMGFKSTDEYMEDQAKNLQANKRVYAMEAELKVQGDPNIAGPDQVFGKTVSIIVISPFHIEQSGYCGDWLAKPGCHPVYSNKAWWIKGVDHTISAGSYVTTLRLALVAPGSDANASTPFGGGNSGGWNPS